MGVIWGVIVTVRGAVAAHCPAPGVKVYVALPAVDVPMVVGFQVPVIPLVEVAGNVGGVEFWQSGPIGLKDGIVGGFTVTVAVEVGPGQLFRLGVIVYVTVPGVFPVAVNV